MQPYRAGKFNTGLAGSASLPNRKVQCCVKRKYNLTHQESSKMSKKEVQSYPAGKFNPTWKLFFVVAKTSRRLVIVIDARGCADHLSGCRPEINTIIKNCNYFNKHFRKIASRSTNAYYNKYTYTIHEVQYSVFAGRKYLMKFSSF